jgi:uncharacterized protein (TIGR00369 family)
MPSPDLQTIRSWLEETPFHRFLGVQLVSFEASEQRITIKLPFRPEFARMPDSNQLHGGLMACLIDIAGDFALAAALEASVPTINFRVDYFRPAAGSELKAVAQVRKAGRTIGVADVEVFDDRGQLLAVGRGCYSTALRAT